MKEVDFAKQSLSDEQIEQIIKEQLDNPAIKEVVIKLASK
jgi:hypothetical protein